MQGSAKRSENTMQHYDSTELPSKFQLGEYVQIELNDEEVLRHGQVIKVHFSKEKVMYDLEFTVMLHEGKRYTTRLHNIDSTFVKGLTPPKDRLINIQLRFSIKDLPTDSQPDARCSDDLLIDTDGTGKFFRVGYYVWSEEEGDDNEGFRLYSSDDGITICGGMKWDYLPIKR